MEVDETLTESELSRVLLPGNATGNHTEGIDELSFKLLSIAIIEVCCLVLVEHLVDERAHLLDSFLLEGDRVGQGGRP